MSTPSASQTELQAALKARLVETGEYDKSVLSFQGPGEGGRAPSQG